MKTTTYLGDGAYVRSYEGTDIIELYTGDGINEFSHILLEYNELNNLMNHLQEHHLELYTKLTTHL